MTFDRTHWLPGAKPPSLAWYCKYARLVWARYLESPAADPVNRCLAFLGACAVFVATVLHYRAQAQAHPTMVWVVNGQGVLVQTAWIQIVVMIAVMLIAALVAYAMRPKVKEPEIAKVNVPVADDGKSQVRLYGCVWFDDSMMLGVKQFPRVPIKATGGKKG